ncbi:MAG: hypothetical protein Q4E61_02590 [Alphaproteobacteria bacterium]|nr:hypothetical protein [Alphaproteobacteria bacterium]
MGKYETYRDFFEKYGKIVADLEDQIEEIKNMDSWKKGINYFKKMQYNGDIEYAPCKSNRYVLKN